MRLKDGGEVIGIGKPASHRDIRNRKTGVNQELFSVYDSYLSYIFTKPEAGGAFELLGEMPGTHGKTLSQPLQSQFLTVMLRNISCGIDNRTVRGRNAALRAGRASETVKPN